MKIVDGSLRIRSPANARRAISARRAALADADGFVDTGDIVELRGERYYFVGRRGGIINVGGLKVHPEEVEAVINRHPRVRMSLVQAAENPITGAIVVADVVLKGERRRRRTPQQIAVKRRDPRSSAAKRLPRHKVPAAIRFVPALDVAATGKLARRYA